jgi:hypothetical protein
VICALLTFLLTKMALIGNKHLDCGFNRIKTITNRIKRNEIIIRFKHNNLAYVF